MSPATASDGLRFKVSAVEIVHLHAIGTIPGVAILAVAALNGIGAGQLRSVGDGTELQWRAPGSSNFGNRVQAGVDGTYMLTDGDNAGKWLRVQVYATYLLGPSSAQVLLADRYDNNLAADDVTAAEASAGSVETYQITMENVTGITLAQPTLWLDAAVADLEISDDGAAWVSPTTELTGLLFPDLAPAGTDIFHLRRTITAGASADPDVLNHLNFSWFGM